MRAIGYSNTINKVHISPYLPDFIADGIAGVDFERLKAIGIKHLLLDLDQTLRRAYSRGLDQKVIALFAELRRNHTFESITIVSNNNRNLSRYSTPIGARVFQPFWENKRLIRKPNAKFYQRVLDELRIRPEETVMIGDKVRLDVGGANRLGMYTVLVRRMGIDYWFDHLMLARWREHHSLARALWQKSRHGDSTPHYLRRALLAIGITVTSIKKGAQGSSEAQAYIATTSQKKLFIRLLTRRQRTAAWLFKLWRHIHPSWQGDDAPFLSPKRVLYHQLDIIQTARAAHVQTPAAPGVVDLGDYRYGIVRDYIDGGPLSQQAPATLSPALLHEVWRQVHKLHKAGIAHGDLRTANILIDTSQKAWLVDFDFAALHASWGRRALDSAELLTSLALTFDPQVVVRAAHGTLAAEEWRLLRRTLKKAHLTPQTYRALHQHPDKHLFTTLQMLVQTDKLG